MTRDFFHALTAEERAVVVRAADELNGDELVILSLLYGWFAGSTSSTAWIKTDSLKHLLAAGWVEQLPEGIVQLTADGVEAQGIERTEWEAELKARLRATVASP